MKKRIFGLTFLAIMILTLLTACGTKVTWVDADGTVLHALELEKDEMPPERELPADNDDWHYVKWTETKTNRGITYVADRVAMQKLIWRDVDGTVLHAVTIIPGDEIPLVGLPNDTAEWQYIRWNETQDGNTVTYTAERRPKMQVTWVDADGRELYRESLIVNANISTRDLPEDTEKWVYTEWKQEKNGNNVIFSAQAVPAKTVIWKDPDGAEVARDYVPKDAPVPEEIFPNGSSKWQYTGWTEQKTENGDCVYVAQGVPKASYFAGNVFQVVGADLLGNPISLGSGFVLNKDGWFITSYRVLEGALSAHGVFEIRNNRTREPFTKLDIIKVSYCDPKKDILIGKLENYSTVAYHYQPIPLQSHYEVGDVTYSVGFPDGETAVKMHEGKVLNSLSVLEKRLPTGVTYISSDSYIRDGSSGGILVNEDLEVIGMTAKPLIEYNRFTLGASINVNSYRVLVQNYAKDSAAKDIANVFQPKIAKYIRLFRMLDGYKDSKLVTDSSGTHYEITVKKQGKSSDSEQYVTNGIYRFYPTGEIVAEKETSWSDGDARSETLSGNYFLEGSLDSFNYMFRYDWASGRGYTIRSSNINYSENVSQTLRSFEQRSYGGILITDDNIKYAKERFNELYSYLKNLLDEA